MRELNALEKKVEELEKKIAELEQQLKEQPNIIRQLIHESFESWAKELNEISDSL